MGTNEVEIESYRCIWFEYYSQLRLVMSVVCGVLQPGGPYLRLGHRGAGDGAFALLIDLYYYSDLV